MPGGGRPPSKGGGAGGRRGGGASLGKSIPLSVSTEVLRKANWDKAMEAPTAVDGGGKAVLCGSLRIHTVKLLHEVNRGAAPPQGMHAGMVSDCDTVPGEGGLDCSVSDEVSDIHGDVGFFTPTVSHASSSPRLDSPNATSGSTAANLGVGSSAGLVPASVRAVGPDVGITTPVSVTGCEVARVVGNDSALDGLHAHAAPVDKPLGYSLMPNNNPCLISPNVTGGKDFSGSNKVGEQDATIGCSMSIDPSMHISPDSRPGGGEVVLAMLGNEICL